MNTQNSSFNVSHVSPRQAALWAGFGLLLMTVLAPFADMYVLPQVLIPGDAAATTAQLLAHQDLLRQALFCFLLVSGADLIVAWALYILLRPVNPELALLMAWLRLVYTVIFALSLAAIFAALSNAEEALFWLQNFKMVWNIGFPFFGLHLGLLGWLAFRSGYIPRLLGFLLALAGLGYLIDSCAQFLLANYAFNLALYTFVGEPLFIFWLLWRGFAGLKQGAQQR